VSRVDAAPGAARGRGRQSLRDMMLSITVIMAIVGVVVIFQQRGAQRLNVIDPTSVYAGARNAATYPVRTPHLPSSWRVTSARTQPSADGRLTLRVGLLTPKGQYAGLVESDQPPADLLGHELSPDVRTLGVVTVEGVPWQRLPAPQKGDRAIARTLGRVTYLVSGSAGLPELEVLAGSLR